jgi:Helicase associated domain
MFAELRRYKERFRDCDVPQGWKENPRLGRWINVQRLAMKHGTLSPERKARLDALGFIWNAVDAKWEARLAELKDYKRRFGDCNVPDRWPENPQLGMWVQNQRMFQKRGQLSPERKALLDALGFEWSRRRSR